MIDRPLVRSLLQVRAPKVWISIAWYTCACVHVCMDLRQYFWPGKVFVALAWALIHQSGCVQCIGAM